MPCVSDRRQFLSMAAGGIAAGWAAYRPDAKWPFKVANDKPDKNGWSITRVYNRFDVTGSQDWYQAGDREYDWPATQGRSYRACTSFGSVYLEFERYPRDVWRVTSKSAYW